MISLVLKSTLETESDIVTERLFNLDSLNDDRPEVLVGAAWRRGQISESPEEMVENLVQISESPSPFNEMLFPLKKKKKILFKELIEEGLDLKGVILVWV